MRESTLALAVAILIWASIAFLIVAWLYEVTHP